jgi:hypothetical protein
MGIDFLKNNNIGSNTDIIIDIIQIASLSLSTARNDGNYR